MYIQSPSLIIPNEFKIKHKQLVRGPEYFYNKERELNYGLGKKGWQVLFYNSKKCKTQFDKTFKYYRRFCFENENDALEFWQEIHRPDFNSASWIIDPKEYDETLFLLTQSLTSTSGANQSFSVPSTWGPNNTISCLGHGGSGYLAFSQSGGGSPPSYGGGAGGGGAFASISGTGLDRNSTTVKFYVSINTGANQDTWFDGSSFSDCTVGAKNGGNGTGPTPNTGGTAGSAASSVGTTKFSGGAGGNGAVVVGNAGGGGGGGCGSSIGTGQTGVSASNGTGQKGGNSSTATGGAAIASGANNGALGTDFDASHGGGSGASGGGCTDAVNRAGGTGGLYGSGSGGSGANNLGTSDFVGAVVAGRQGMIFLSWSPYEYNTGYSN